MDPKARTEVLVVEDDEAIRRGVCDVLAFHGRLPTGVATGDDGLRCGMDPRFSLVILDVMLPGLDGFEVLRRIRARSTVPVLMLTARGDETDRIVGLEVGADDYLPKTSSTRELLARLRAILRRSAAAPAPGTPSPPREIVIGPLRLNLDARAAVLGDAPLALTPVEFDLLASLARARGRVKTREALLDEIRNRHYDVFDRSIDVHISSLRRKLGDDAKQPRYIRTLRSAGYMLAEVAQPLPPSPR